MLECRFAAQRSGLIADQSRLQQLIWNLLRNAVKFTPEGGCIRINTYDARSNDGGRSKLRLEVNDSGIGIESEEMERIFRPFEQVHSNGDHQFAGLGLAIAMAIVDLHHGRIRVESAGEGKGASFIVEIPDAIEPPNGVMDFFAETSPVAEDPKISCQPLKLLLVEDHQATPDVLRRMLETDGHHVTAVSRISHALDAARQTESDYLVSDLGLPDGTGYTLMEELRETRRLRGVALSGYGMEDEIE